MAAARAATSNVSARAEGAASRAAIAHGRRRRRPPGDDGAWSADLQARTRYRVIKVADQARWAGIAMTWRAALAGGSVPRTDPK